RLRQHAHQRGLDRGVVGVDVDADQSVRGAPTNDADAGLAFAPEFALALARNFIQEPALPCRQWHPQSGAEEAWRLGAEHDRHRGIAALNQYFGALRIRTHHRLLALCCRWLGFGFGFDFGFDFEFGFRFGDRGRLEFSGRRRYRHRYRRRGCFTVQALPGVLGVAPVAAVLEIAAHGDFEFDSLDTEL